MNGINGIPLWAFLIIAAALFCIGLYGALARKNAVALLMGVELMLNGVNLNLIAFWRFIAPDSSAGLVFAAFVFIHDAHGDARRAGFGRAQPAAKIDAGGYALAVTGVLHRKVESAGQLGLGHCWVCCCWLRWECFS